MEAIKIPYGQQNIKWKPPEGFSVEMIYPKDAPGIPDQIGEVVRALEEPINSKKLEDFSGIKTVAIVISDLTRPVPNKIILPPIINKLEKMGVNPKDIKVIVGTGLHRVSTQDDFVELLGEDLANKVTVISHDALDEKMQVHCGMTRLGTPVKVNKHYVEADLRLLTGMIEPHQIVGFSGGAKALAIGLGSKELIQANHAMLTDERAQLGKLEGNPPREDIDEVGKIVGVDFIVNVIVNNKKEIVKAVAGDFLAAHKEGVRIARKLFEVQVDKPADVIVVSPGGYPKDINAYQAQKGLLHAARAVKENGYIILLADCREGVGDDKFLATMERCKNPMEVIDYFKARDFEVGVHKAFLWCRSLIKAKTYLISHGIDDKTARSLMVQKRSSIDEVLKEIDGLPKNAKIIVMPKANSTIPMVGC